MGVKPHTSANSTRASATIASLVMVLTVMPSSDAL
jgi:hypothetical protein